jgi:hypothetical protein
MIGLKLETPKPLTIKTVINEIGFLGEICYPYLKIGFPRISNTLLYLRIYILQNISAKTFTLIKIQEISFMLLRTTSWLALSVFLLTLSGTAEIAESKAEKKKSVQPAKKQAKIEGFRSAKFGMKEKDIYRAITKDFKIAKGKVRRNEYSLEKTTSLEITVPKLLGVGGTAKIGYTIGYKSKRLMQVNIIWGRGAEESGRKVKAQDIVDAANFLRNHLIKKEYKEEGFIANGRMNDVTTIVFRGKDKKNRMALLVLTTPKAQKGEDAKKAGEKVSLKLSYMLDAEKPDILTIGDDDF